MFRVQRHAALIFYRALRLLIHFFNRLEPKLCPIAHIKVRSRTMTECRERELKCV